MNIGSVPHAPAPEGPVPVARPRRSRPVWIVCAVVVALAACDVDREPADPARDQYREAVSAFHVSLAAIETDQASFAFFKMSDVADLYPEEPAVWANLGVFALRQGNLALAAEQMTRARDLAPGEADILFLSAIVENRRGNQDEAISFLRSAVEADPADLRVRFALLTELERQDDVGNAEEIEEHLGVLLDQDPDNLVLRLEQVRLAAKVEDSEGVDRALASLGSARDWWPPTAREQFDRVVDTAGRGDFGQLSLELAFLQNELAPLPEFRRSSARIQLPPDQIAFTIPRFIHLPQPDFTAAPPDRNLTFDPQSQAGAESEAALAIRSVTLSETAPPLALVVHSGQAMIDGDTRVPFPGEPVDPLGVHSVAQLDFDYDFLMDLAFVGTDGFRLLQQSDDFSFTDVTADLGLPPALVDRPYRAIWAIDVDVDGDLDLVLSPLDGGPIVLRNNGDRTFTPIELFDGVSSPVDFAWADLDADGVPDALFLDSDGILHFAENLRGGEMAEGSPLPVSSGVVAIAVADVTADAYLDLLALTVDGTIHRIYNRPHLSGWESEEWIGSAAPGVNLTPGEASIFAEDLDNNGSLDLLVTTPTGTFVWLSDDAGSHVAVDQTLDGRVMAVVDLDGDGRLDLLGVTPDLEPFRLINQSTLDYGFRSIRVRASGPLGDQRINSFGIGGELEVRSGLMYQKQLIRTPIVHFGLGDHVDAEMLRIIWPNGSVQAEFTELGMGETLFGEQILKGSCPWLFVHDGEEHRFVTDLIWRSPLGLRINAQETAGVMQTEDRVRIPGDLMRPTDGVYDLRITAELWETHFFDEVRLVAVDHPVGSEVYIDERFVAPPPDLDFRITGVPQPVERVLDGEGHDVSHRIREIDQVYLHAFRRTPHQGLAEEHQIEIVLGADAPAEGPLWLLGHGWIRPTDSSINLALSQGSIDPPAGIRVDVPDGEGGWVTTDPDFGFPAGKTKTVMLDLEGLFPDPDDRRIRLTTTSEVYWDAIQWAEGYLDVDHRERELEPVRMELGFRGYSEVNKEDDFSPEIPNYNVISGTTPRWQDLVGFYTRYGDVSELLAEVDDRYVIMNAGDELHLEFAALDEPEEGYHRTFVMIVDGWVKDGDFNTEFSKTVTPLPSHDSPEYVQGYERLEDDPVYQRHTQDWVDYHTRYVTPTRFREALTFGLERRESMEQ
jgi:tetratricopeptide (TPR) repeat protein